MPNISATWNTGEYSPPKSSTDYTFVGLILCEVSIARVEAAQVFRTARRERRLCEGVAVLRLRKHSTSWRPRCAEDENFDKGLGDAARRVSAGR